MRRFREAKFTFSNRRKGADETKARLDRVVVNKVSMELFPKALVCNSWALGSDHRPVALLLEKQTKRVSNHSGFMFEPMWTRDNSFSEKVKAIWRKVTSRNLSLGENLRVCGEDLKRWNY
ncbi:hypothetical protein QQ045_003611 [Rhodiola kirilowii]